MIGKRVLVTGGTNGIGKQTALELAKLGAEIVIVGRNEAKTHNVRDELIALSSNKHIDILIADLSSMDDIRRIANEYLEKYDRLDVLINNAGAMFTEYQLSADGYEMTIALNHFSYYLLTNLLLDTLKKTAQKQGEARIINVSSSAHDTGVNRKDYQLANVHDKSEFRGLKNYSISKLMNVLFTYELARRLEDTAVTVNAVHPGVTDSGFGHNTGGFSLIMIKIVQKLFAIAPEKAAETIIYLASTKESSGISGKYWSKQQPVNSSDISYDRHLQTQLWDYSAKATGIS